MELDELFFTSITKAGLDSLEGTLRYTQSKESEGYEWCEAAEPVGNAIEMSDLDVLDRNGPWLLPRIGSANSKASFPLRWAGPDAKPLHRQFAQLGFGKKVLVRFANRFGLLGYDTFVLRQDAQTGMPKFGESLMRWRYEVGRMALVTSLWDAVRMQGHGGEQRLEGILQWQERDEESDSLRLLLAAEVTWQGKTVALHPVAPSVLERLPSGRLWGAYMSRGWMPWELRDSNYVAALASEQTTTATHIVTIQMPSGTFKHGDLIAPASWLCIQMLNSAIGTHDRITNIRIAVSAKPSDVKPRVVLEPRSLLSTLWAGFLLEVVGDRNLVLCPGCNEWFEAADRRRETCSERCRQRKHRRPHRAERSEDKAGQRSID